MSASETTRPVISALLVIRNEAACVEECVESILAQTFPAEQYELIIVDGMSTDGTRERIQRILTRHPDRSIRLFDNPRRILSSGWNIGIREARGDYVIRPDAHAAVPRGFLERSMAVMRSHPEASAVGGILKTVGKGFWGKAIAAALSSRMGVGGSSFRVGGRPGPADTVVFALYRRDCLLSIGGFDETIPLNQDNVCHARLREKGAVLYFDPSIESVYYCRSSLRALWRQMFRRSLWLMRMLKHQTKKTFSVRYFAPLCFVLLLLGLMVGGLIWPPLIGAALVLLLCYAGAGWYSSLRMELSSLQKAVMPLVFLTIHAAYGVGSLLGMLSLLFYRPVPPEESLTLRCAPVETVGK